MFRSHNCDKLNNIGDGFLLLATEQEEKPDKFSQEFKRLDDKITDEITSEYVKRFDEMMRVSKWDINGETFHAALLDEDALDQWDALIAEEIDEAKDRRKYRENYRKRACILIKDLTLEKSKKIEFYPLEDLVTAWGRRANTRGFHLIRKPISPETASTV